MFLGVQIGNNKHLSAVETSTSTPFAGSACFCKKGKIQSRHRALQFLKGSDDIYFAVLRFISFASSGALEDFPRDFPANN